MTKDAASATPLPNHTDETAPDRLDVQQWYRRIYAFCQARLICDSDSEDAAQETFVRAIIHLHRLRTRDAIGGWLRQIAHNVCVDMIRRQQVRRSAGIDVQSIPTENEADAPADRDQKEHLMRLIAALPEPQREVLLLHYYDNLTYDEIAAWLGVARSTVHDRLHRARMKLKAELTTTGDAP
ncbi:RNA polymerase sigma factor SigM [Stieleria maiorica]|uniref:RNA polymerase sigma factor SigM n=1 Tax=Stieleria maiorica TaxID=2795974 RepID=A0A5B9MGG9_9BACT|nr:RNA polymerase sigma factor [Stieleria maiorica]QEF98674.1 RNA polymerase sigma factor SigM [Stieleria maiorica]